ncbi:MAG: LLM class flavin-dependent oxidoreductase, partial [Caldilineaceae bacterium]|nr:LLM class flavin-dependent oxidoreductase [Caldilineaceae bacterium]
NPPEKDSLELWTSLTWLASNTQRIEFGPLVTPVSFRDPVFTARIAKDVDDLSGGRLILGVGAGWQEREHHMFGYDLMPPAQRFARFEEGLDVITHLLQDAGRVNHSGSHYTLRDAALLPRPQRPGGPPILIGGNGPRRTLPLVARYGHEWNGVYVTAERFAALSQQLDTLLAAQGREPGAVRRSLMTNVIFGSSETTLRDKLAGRDATALRQRGLIVGTAPAIRDQLLRLAEAGVQRVMLQWLDQDDLAGLETLAQAVL